MLNQLALNNKENSSEFIPKANNTNIKNCADPDPGQIVIKTNFGNDSNFFQQPDTSNPSPSNSKYRVYLNHLKKKLIPGELQLAAPLEIFQRP